MKNIFLLPTVALLAGVALSRGTASNSAAANKVQIEGLRGFVCGPDRRPLPNTTVLVNMRKTTTDGRGSFFIPHKQLERQGPTLIVLAQGKLQGKKLKWARFVDYVTHKENISIRLWCSASISGHVLASDGGPIAGALVSALMNVGQLTCHGTSPTGPAVKTDENGRFNIPDLYPDTRYRLRVTCPGRERKLTEWISVERRQLSDKLEISLREAPGSVAGQVVDPDGKPMPKVRVVLGHPCISEAVCITDAQGAFRIEDLVPGEVVTLSIGWDFHKVKVGTEDLLIVAGDRDK